MFGGFDLEMIAGPRIPFNKEYRCYSVSMMPGNGRNDVENGGKIILPPSALDHLTRLNTAYPMLFKLTNSRKNRLTHCGVLEFIADEGRCYIPNWMMRNLLLEEGNIVRVQSTQLPVASFSKFEPQTSEFLDITNPKAVLENALRNFACLTAGDIVAIRYNDKVYELRVLETKPGSAVSIIECDMDVDFAPPPDYVEPTRENREAMDVTEDPEFDAAEAAVAQFRAFGGSGNRLDGKAAESMQSNSHPVAHIRGVPDYDFNVGRIQFFHRRLFPSANDKKDLNEEGFKAFEGKGEKLKAVTIVDKNNRHVNNPAQPPNTSVTSPQVASELNTLPPSRISHTPFQDNDLLQDGLSSSHSSLPARPTLSTESADLSDILDFIDLPDDDGSL